MQDLVRYRAMESLCRQSAVFHPLDSWRLLAEAEMWHHKALEIASRCIDCNSPRRPVHFLEQKPFLTSPAKADCWRAKVWRNPFSLAKLIAEPVFRTRIIMVNRKERL
jgi:hypothetical protein